MSGPQANCFLMSSQVTVVVTAAKLTRLGSSLITYHPVSAQQVVSSVAWTAVSASRAQASGTSA